MTDIPLTENGRELARLLRPALARQNLRLSSSVRCSAHARLARWRGSATRPSSIRDLAEWNYGEYEGMTPGRSTQIPRLDGLSRWLPGWRDAGAGRRAGRPGHCAGARGDGDVALFAHGHVLRMLGARWIGLPPAGRRSFPLDTGTLCILGFYRDVPAVKVWNGPAAASWPC